MPGAFILCALEVKRQQKIKENIRRRCLRDSSNPMDLPESAFCSLYRVSKSAFIMILSEIDSLIVNNPSIPVNLQLAATLRYCAVGGYQSPISNDLHSALGKSTLCKILWNVMDALETKLCYKWIKLQQSEENIIASKLFYQENYGFPGVIGCVDGTHIRMVKPKKKRLEADEQEEDYDYATFYNRKGFFSMNVMIICDNKMRIMAVDGCRPGASHDAFIWSLSDARRYYKEKYDNGILDGWLLGDSKILIFCLYAALVY